MTNWENLKEFNFTYALPDGAWIKDSDGNINWESYTSITKHKGAEWFAKQRQRQGMFTGCWIPCA